MIPIAYSNKHSIQSTVGCMCTLNGFPTFTSRSLLGRRRVDHPRKHGRRHFLQAPETLSWQIQRWMNIWPQRYIMEMCFGHCYLASSILFETVLHAACDGICFDNNFWKIERNCCRGMFAAICHAYHILYIQVAWYYLPRTCWRNLSIVLHVLLYTFIMFHPYCNIMCLYIQGYCYESFTFLRVYLSSMFPIPRLFWLIWGGFHHGIVCWYVLSIWRMTMLLFVGNFFTFDFKQQNSFLLLHHFHVCDHLFCKKKVWIRLSTM